MNKKTYDRCLAVIASAFVSGEEVEMVEVVQIGKVSAKRQIGVAIAAGIASGGTLMVAVRPRSYFLILTNFRLFLIDNNNGRVGKEIVSAVPREAVQPRPLQGHMLTRSMEVTISGNPYRFSWGRLQPGANPDGIAAALAATAPPPPAAPDLGTAPHSGVAPPDAPHSGAAPHTEMTPRPGTASYPDSAPYTGMAPHPGAAPQHGIAPQPGAAPQQGMAPYPAAASHPGGYPGAGPRQDAASWPAIPPHGAPPHSVAQNGMAPHPGTAPEPRAMAQPGAAPYPGGGSYPGAGAGPYPGIASNDDAGTHPGAAGIHGTGQQAPVPPTDTTKGYRGRHR